MIRPLFGWYVTNRLCTFSHTCVLWTRVAFSAQLNIPLVTNVRLLCSLSRLFVCLLTSSIPHVASHNAVQYSTLHHSHYKQKRTVVLTNCLECVFIHTPESNEQMKKKEKKKRKIAQHMEHSIHTASEKTEQDVELLVEHIFTHACYKGAYNSNIADTTVYTIHHIVGRTHVLPDTPTTSKLSFL